MPFVAFDETERVPTESRIDIARKRWEREADDSQLTDSTWRAFSTAAADRRIHVELKALSCRQTVCRCEIDFASSEEIARAADLRRPEHDFIIDKLSRVNGTITATAYIAHPDYPFGRGEDRDPQDSLHERAAMTQWESKSFASSFGSPPQ